VTFNGMPNTHWWRFEDGGPRIVVPMDVPIDPSIGFLEARLPLTNRRPYEHPHGRACDWMMISGADVISTRIG